MEQFQSLSESEMEVSGNFEFLLKISFACHLPQHTLIARRVIAVARVRYARRALCESAERLPDDAIKDVFQTDGQVIEQTAFKFRHYSGSFLIRHVLQVIRRILRINIAQEKFAVFKHILLYRAAHRVNNPIFADATTLIRLLLLAFVVAGRAGGQDFHDQIRSAIDAFLAHFVRVADHHHVGLVLFAIRQKERRAIRDRSAFLAVEIIAENSVDVPRDEDVVHCRGRHHHDFAADDFLLRFHLIRQIPVDVSVHVLLLFLVVLGFVILQVYNEVIETAVAAPVLAAALLVPCHHIAPDFRSRPIGRGLHHALALYALIPPLLCPKASVASAANFS